MSQDPTQPNPPTDPFTEDTTVAEPFVVALPDDTASGRDWYLWVGVLALLTMVSFWPAISGGFLWGDDDNVTQNMAVRSPQGLQQIWAPTEHATQYYPLTQTTFWAEYQMWKNWPLGYRVVNLVLHAAGAIVLWRLLRRLRLPGAWVAAAIWAIHPLQTESVAWVSQRSNILSGLLAFSSLLFYVEFAGLTDPASSGRVWKLTNRWQAYIIAVILFAAAMFSKTVVCGLPVAILLILWWKRRLTAETIAGLVPMFIFAVVMAAITVHIETDPHGAIAATGKPWDLSFATRVLVAGHALWFYAGKLILPIHQSFIYPRHVPSGSDNSQWLMAMAVVVLVVILLSAVHRIGRGPIVAVLCYIVALFPVLGFFNVYPMVYSFVWDHFQYLASAPLIVLAVVIAARVLSPSSFDPQPEAPMPPPDPAAVPAPGAPPLSVIVPAAAAAILLGVLATTSWLRAQVFVSTSALWDDTVAKNPDSWLAQYKLGQESMKLANELLDQGARLATSDKDSSNASYDAANDQLNDADKLIRTAIDNPATLEYIRTDAYGQLGAIENLRARVPKADVPRLMESARYYLREAIARERAQDSQRPDASPYFTIGISTQTMAEQLVQQLMPNTANSTQPLTAPTSMRPPTAAETQVIEKYEQARRYFATAIEIAEAGIKLPATRAESLRVLELASFNRGNIDFTLAGLSLGRGDMQKTDQYNKDAIIDYQLTLQVNPRKVEAHYKLALCLERFNQWDDAMAHLKVIVYSLDHFYWRGYNEIGHVLLAHPHATVADLQLAIQCFQDALKLNPHSTDAQDNLAKAMKLIHAVHSTTNPSTVPATQP